MKRNDYRLPDHVKEDFFKHKPEWMKRIACGCYSLGDVREAMEYVLAVTNECDDLGRETAKLIERLKLILIKKEDIMEEKKTKKMTKVEAYVYLNDTKVYVNGKGDKILEVLSKVGFEPTFSLSDVNAFPFMLISDKQVTYYGHMKQYLGLPQKEISADDILSIEIVEEKKEKFVDCSKPCDEIGAVQELLRNSKHLKDKTLVITKDNAVIL